MNDALLHQKVDLLVEASRCRGITEGVNWTLEQIMTSAGTEELAERLRAYARRMGEHALELVKEADL